MRTLVHFIIASLAIVFNAQSSPTTWAINVPWQFYTPSTPAETSLRGTVTWNDSVSFFDPATWSLHVDHFDPSLLPYYPITIQGAFPDYQGELGAAWTFYNDEFTTITLDFGEVSIIPTLRNGSTGTVPFSAREFVQRGSLTSERIIYEGLAYLAYPGFCEPQWLPSTGLRGTNGTVYALAAWDPDGSGPADTLVVIGGNFSAAGNKVARNIAAWDPATNEWYSLGDGVEHPVYALAILPNGDVVTGGQQASRWNGSAWTSLGISNPHNALTVLPDGTLVYGGFGCYMWTGTSWSPVPGLGNEVHALCTLDGDLVAGGSLAVTTGPHQYTGSAVARWNGTYWSPLGMGLNDLNEIVYALAALENGDLVAGGDFTGTFGGQSLSKVARWDGTTWQPLASGISGAVRSIIEMPNGDIIAGGDFSAAGGVNVSNIARWNGTSWSAVGSGADMQVNALVALPDTEFVAGGAFQNTGDDAASRVAHWTGASWSVAGSGFNSNVSALCSLSEGDLVAGGDFTSAGNVTANRIARWNGAAWAPLGLGVSSSGVATPVVNAITELPNGDVVAGGQFMTAGEVEASRIARWNGSEWFALGNGMNGVVYALTTLQNGDLVAGGSFSTAGGVTVNRVAKWDGVSWHALASGMNGSVRALLLLSNGDLIAGGLFTTAGGGTTNGIARWNGTNWSAIGSGMNGPVHCLTLLPDGDLVAGGEFTNAGGTAANRIARWNGASWAAMGSGMNGTVRALATRPDGRVVAGGEYTTADGNTVNYVARWDGTTWASLGSGLGGTSSPYVLALANLPNGDLALGGSFVTAGTLLSPHWARWVESQTPWVVNGPDQQELEKGQTLVLSATPAIGYSHTSVQWQRNGINIVEGSGGASGSGGTVSGSWSLLESPTDGDSVTLTITNAQPSDSGDYVAVFANPCGIGMSEPAVIIIAEGCRADVNGDTVVDILDYLDFLDSYGTCEGLPGPCSGTSGIEADFNGDTLVDILDLLEFFDEYGAGCD